MPSFPISPPPSPTSHLTLAITTPNHFLSPPLTLGWVSDIPAQDASYSSLPWILHPPPPPPSSLLGNLRLPAAYFSLTTLWRQHHLLETLRSWGWYPALRSHRTHLPLPSTCRMTLKKMTLYRFLPILDYASLKRGMMFLFIPVPQGLVPNRWSTDDS